MDKKVIKNIVLPSIVGILLVFTYAAVRRTMILDTGSKQEEAKFYVIAKCPTCSFEYKKSYVSTNDGILRLPLYYCQKCVNPLVWTNE